MATAPEKKVSTAAKAPVVPAKKIATAAAKVSAKLPVKTAEKTAAAKPVAAKVVKPAAKVATKPAFKLAAKSSVKPAPKVPTTPVTKSTEAKPAVVKEKAKKAKLVRDSFTMPETEYAVLGHVKKVCLAAGMEVKKSQLLRIGVLLLSKMDVARLRSLIANLEPLKAGRPKKDK